MCNAMKAEWYKLRHDMLIWIVPLYYIFVGCYSTTYYHEIMNYRKGLELFGMPDVAWVQLAFATVIVSGYVMGGDFSRHTIQNALAVGTSKKSYYFGRLLVQMQFAAGMFGIALFLHTVGRLVHPMGNSQVVIDYLWGKILVYMFVVLLLIWAYVSIMNMLVYFVQKQVIVMAAGIGFVYAEVIIRQVAIANDWKVVQYLVNWLPSNLERNLLEHAVYDTIFTAEFFRYGLCGIAVIVLSSAVGYVKFCYGTDVN